jgi:hypothetical protein
MKRLTAIAVVVAFSVVAGAARGDDKKDDKKGDKAGVTGTWKWTVEANGQKRDVTLKLKQDGDKLTGSMPGRNNNETKIDDATIKDGKISFTVTRERNGNKVTTKYSGKVEGDVLKLKIEREGQEAREVEAKRATD